MTYKLHKFVTKMTQTSVRLTLQPKLYNALKDRINDLGVSTSTYIQHLILGDIKSASAHIASERVNKAFLDSKLGINEKIIDEDDDIGSVLDSIK